MDSPIKKEVVVIGNGPSAIALSYMLAGHWPYYKGSDIIPEFLHYRLLDNVHESLIKQDLYYLSDGLEGRSHNPVSLLLDILQHPAADLGEENEAALKWIYDSDQEVNHVVLGKGPPGGAWHKMEGNILTISLGSWMELPGLKIKEWDVGHHRDSEPQTNFMQKRTTVSTVGKYYCDYIKQQKLGKYFINNFTVESISQNSDRSWIVSGFYNGQPKSPVRFLTPKVVLATGNSDQPNLLKIPGEKYPFVMHSLGEFESLVKKNIEPGNILIVGAGLSAADAVIAARLHGFTVFHAFRRTTEDHQLIFKKLPANMYPEYHKVYNMMCTSGSFENYKPYPAHIVSHILPNKQVILKSHSGHIKLLRVSYILILIGMHPNLTFLPNSGKDAGIHPDRPINCQTNPIETDLITYETSQYPGIYAMGPLVGDNFVRFVQGGALGITSHIVQQKEALSMAEP